MAVAYHGNKPQANAYEAFPDGPEFYRQDGMDDALKRLFKAAVAHGESRLEWYDKKAGDKGKVARRLRSLALCLFAIGTLAPIFLTLLYKLAQSFGSGKPEQAALVDLIAKVPLAEVGFVSLGVAGALVIFDQFFDTSGTWIRFRQAQARLGVLLADLRFAWAGLLVGAGGTFSERATAVAAVKLLRDFVGQVEQIAEAETREWADRFRSRISAFDGNSSLKVRLDPVDAGQAGSNSSTNQGTEAGNHQRSSRKPAEVPPELGIVRVSIERITEYDAGTIKLRVDSVGQPVPPDGVVMLRLELGKRHSLEAEATKSGAKVNAKLDIEPAVSAESRSYTLTLAP